VNLIKFVARYVRVLTDMHSSHNPVVLICVPSVFFPKFQVKKFRLDTYNSVNLLSNYVGPRRLK
jgi:hypothetical protein